MKKFEIVYQDLKAQIINNEITTMLPSETSIMQHYKVGRGSARMAITKLVDEGYCISKHGIGSFVLPALRKNSPKVNYEIADYETVKIDNHLHLLTKMPENTLVLKITTNGYDDEFLMTTSTTYLTIDDYKDFETQVNEYLNLLNKGYQNYVKTDNYSCIKDSFKIKNVRYTYNLDGSIYEYSEFVIDADYFNISLVNNK